MALNPPGRLNTGAKYLGSARRGGRMGRALIKQEYGDAAGLVLESRWLPAATGAFTGAANVTTATVTLSASGTVATGGGAVSAVTASTSATGVVARTGSASLSVTASRTADGTVSAGAFTGSASLTVSVSTSSAGSAGGSTSTTVTTGLQSTGSVGVFAVASLTGTVTTTASGTVGSGLTGDVSLVATVTVTASGNVATFAAATLTVTATRTPTSSQGLFGSATCAVLALFENRVGTVQVPRAYFTAPIGTERKQPRREGAWWVDTSAGRTLYKKAGTWTVADNPAGYDLAGADYVYRGGRVYTLTDAEIAELTAAGYGASIYYE